MKINHDRICFTQETKVGVYYKNQLTKKHRNRKGKTMSIFTDIRTN